MRSKTKVIISLVLIFAMVLQISPLSVLTINAAEAKEPIVTENGVMYVYYDNISTYRTGTLSYPKEEGYVFGGWWSATSVDDNGLIAQPTPLSATDVSVSAWAKYVPEDVLTAKAQVSQRVADVIKEDGTLTAGTSLKLRLVTSVDDSNLYETVGFKVKVNKEKEYTAHIYDSISVREKNNTGAIEPEQAFHKAASQFATVVIGGFDSIERINETELYVTPYWKTLDGTTVEGIVRTRLLTSDDRSSDVDGSQTNGEEDFAVSNDKYSYGATAQSETVSYKYFRGASDSVYLKGQYTPSGANVKFGIIIRNGGQTRQVLFGNAGVLVTNGVDGASVTASGLVNGTYDAYDDVTNADGVYVWARQAAKTTTDSVTTYTASGSAVMDLLAGTTATEVTWAIEENVLYCNIAGETVLRLPMNLLCEKWQDGRYYQVGVAAYNVEAQETNGMAFEKTTLTFGKNAYATDEAEGIISEGNDVTITNAMAYEPITGAYKAATQAGTAYAYGEASTDAQLLTTTIQLPEGDSITSLNGIYLKSGAVYATILIGGNGASATIQINGNSNYKITITDWIESAGITEYYSSNACEVTAGIQDETLYLFINGKLAGSVDLYKLLSYYASKKYYVEGSSVQLGVCAVDSNNGNAAFQEYELVMGEVAETTLTEMLADEDTEVAREWELYVDNNLYTSGKGCDMTGDGYDYTASTSKINVNCHIYGVPTTMSQKLTATVTTTADATPNCIIVRYNDNKAYNYVYGIEGFEDVFEAYLFDNTFTNKWNNEEKQTLYETFDTSIYNVDEDDSYSYDITAVVKDGCVYISYNDKVMYTHQLPDWDSSKAVRLGVYSKVPSGETTHTVYENLTFEAGADVDVPQFMMTSNMTYDNATGVYTPDSSQTGLTYAYSTAATSSQFMSTMITLPENDSSISSSNGLYLKSGDVYTTIMIAGTGTDVKLQVSNGEGSYDISIGDWLTKADITEFFKDGACKLSAGIQDDTLYLFINDKLAGSVDLYKILTYYKGSCYYIEGSSTVQMGVCSSNPASGQIVFKEYALTTGNGADGKLATLLSDQETKETHEWEIFADNNYHTNRTAYNGVVDGYEHTITNVQYGFNNASANCHFYGVPTTMPIKVSATLESTAETAGHGIIVRYDYIDNKGTAGIKNYIYGIHADESTFYGVTAFKWPNRTTISNQVYKETFDEVIYKNAEDGSYTCRITAVVKDGYLNVIYNDEVVFSEYLRYWKEGGVVRLGLYTYCPNGEVASIYSDVVFETAYDHEFIDIDKEAPDAELLSAIRGKKISVLGDSISTFVDVSSGKNASTTNSTIENNAVWYTTGRLGKWQHTYWGRMIEKYDMSLCVNNSASGGMLVRDRDTTTQVAGITRCEQLHDNTGDDAGTTPDIITLYLGANDLMQNVEAGELTADTYASIKDSDGNYITDNLTYTQGYIILLDKVTKLYSDADIFCFTLLPTGNEKESYGDTYTTYRARRLEFNERIREIAAHYGATVVDLEKYAGFTPDNMATYFEGSHPLYQGIYPVSKVFEDALKAKYCSN